MKFYWAVLSLIMMVASTSVAGTAPAIAQQATETGEPSVIWGGNDVSMEVTAQGATLEFDCARGAILEAIKPSVKGEFAARGTYTPELGGPIRKDNPPRDLPAIYKGSIDGDTMRLEVMLGDKQQEPPPFTLTRGRAGHLRKCR